MIYHINHIEHTLIMGQSKKIIANISSVRVNRNSTYHNGLPNYGDNLLKYTVEQYVGLIETYGSLTSAAFAMSMCKFVAQAPLNLRVMINSLLNNTLDYKHTKFLREQMSRIIEQSNFFHANF
ncbi:hypothetical protein HZS_1706 [Henneguya salminicola]|nr:hypothetical protein HZS_1706 [Henneguya salminicola]